MTQEDVLSRLIIGSAIEAHKVKLDCGFRADFVVSGLVILELKAIDEIAPIHLNL